MNDISEVYLDAIQTIDTSYKGIYSWLKSLTAARSCSSTYLDKLPSPAVEKVLSYISVADFFSIYNVSSVFADEVPRTLKLSDKKMRVEDIFSLVDMNKIADLQFLKKIDPGYFLVVDETTGDTLLHRAIERKLPCVRDILLKVDGLQINAINNKKLTPLHLAIKLGDVSLVKKLIGLPDIDANIYFPVEDYQGPFPAFEFEDNVPSPIILHFAIDQGNIDILNVLLNSGKVDTTLSDVNGRTALMRLLIKDSFSANPHELVAIIDSLLIQVANINHRDFLQETLLHYVVRAGYDYLIKDLVRKGIDVNAVSREGFTAVHTAVIFNHEKALVELLQLSNIDANMAGDQGLTPLDFAIGLKNDNFVKLLSEHFYGPL